MPAMSNHPHEHHDLGSEFPEHYDLENASSIAPSDIDIVYHYKGMFILAENETFAEHLLIKWDSY